MKRDDRTNVIALHHRAPKASSAWNEFKERDDWIRQLLAATGDTLSCAAKVVACRIAMHHNIKTGRCDPSIVTLVDGTGMSESSVRRMIKELERAGWLCVDRTSGRHANSFELVSNPVSKVKGLNPARCERVEPKPTLSNVTPQPCQISPPNPVTADRQENIVSNIEVNSEAPRAKGKPKKRHPIPADFKLTDERRQIAIEHGVPADKVQAEFDEWHAWWTKEGKSKPNWHEEWRFRCKFHLHKQYAAQKQRQQASAPRPGFARKRIAYELPTWDDENGYPQPPGIPRIIWEADQPGGQPKPLKNSGHPDYA